MSNVILQSNDITKTYQQGSTNLEILKGVSLDILEGDLISIQGQSGAGKSTLMHILGSIDKPTSGTVVIEGKDILSLDDEELSQFRNKTMGFVFQAHHLLNEFSAIENVMLPALIAGISSNVARELAKELLADVGMDHRMTHFPSELSGGEKQRVSIARALVRKPKILFADEPTGNLDVETSLKVQNVLFDLHKKYKMALVVVTHEVSYAEKFPRALFIDRGRWRT